MSLIFWKSSNVNSISAALAIAKKCNTALVDPPIIVTKRIAFSNDLRVTISKGLISFSKRTLIALPAAIDPAFFASPSAGFEELYGKAIPKASIAEAIVFAVYIPPHAPAPGQAFSITSWYSFSSILPATFAPHASKAETTSNF